VLSPSIFAWSVAALLGVLASVPLKNKSSGDAAADWGERKISSKDLSCLF